MTIAVMILLVTVAILAWYWVEPLLNPMSKVKNLYNGLSNDPITHERQ